MIYGLAVGDALGVPVEFSSREARRLDPVGEMRGYGSYDVPAGSWSDDTSMTLCLLESINRNRCIDYDDIMKNFVRWMDKAEFTPTGVTFDIGRTCMQAIMKYVHGTEPLHCGGASEFDNGNGSLMRISPMVIYLHHRCGDSLDSEGIALIHNVSSLTHGHARSQVACTLYVAIALKLVSGCSFTDALYDGVSEICKLYREMPVHRTELEKTYFRLHGKRSLLSLPEEEIKSSGYVVDTLEAVLWCVGNTSNYRDCVLKAVNLGEDTDTVGAIAGSLAGLLYGMEDIPEDWLNTLQNKTCIESIVNPS